MEQMPKYAKFMKDLLSGKRLADPSQVKLNESCSAELLNEIPLKEKDPGNFTVPCTIEGVRFENALADLGASISLLPYSLYKRLELGELVHTRICFELANKTTKIPKGVAENVLVKIRKFVFLVDFVILEIEEDEKVPVLLGRPFLAAAYAMIDVFNKKKLVGNRWRDDNFLSRKVYEVCRIC